MHQLHRALRLGLATLLTLLSTVAPPGVAAQQIQDGATLTVLRGQVAVVHTFTGLTGAFPGYAPNCLVVGEDDHLYGTGGANNDDFLIKPSNIHGTIFRLKISDEFGPVDDTFDLPVVHASVLANDGIDSAAQPPKVVSITQPSHGDTPEAGKNAPESSQMGRRIRFMMAWKPCVESIRQAMTNPRFVRLKANKNMMPMPESTASTDSETPIAGAKSRNNIP